MTTGERRGRGRPPLVEPDDVVLAARKMLSGQSAASFSVRRLAVALSVTPGTIYARFGTKNELLAQAYLHRIAELAGELGSGTDLADLPLEELLGRLGPRLSGLRADFAVRFELEGGPAQGVRSETWRKLRRSYLQLVSRVYRLIRAASAREGHDLVGGTLAERFVWSVLSSGISERNARVFGHGNATYYRFLANSIVAALSRQTELKERSPRRPAG